VIVRVCGKLINLTLKFKVKFVDKQSILSCLINKEKKMNVNGIDPNLQAQAKQLLQSKEKADHSREDLEVLWEYTKQTKERG